MMINALNSGRQRLHGRLRGLDFADVGQRGQRPAQPPRRRAAHDRATSSPDGKPLPPRRRRGHADGATPRLAPPRAARAGRRRARLRQPVRLRPGLLPQRPRAARPRHRARTSTCPSSRAISRPGCGTTSSSLAQDELGLLPGTIKATVLIETILAAFEMDEILYELREHSAGLNAGRWDYIFSVIKKFAARPGLRPARPRPGVDDRAVHAGLHRAHGEDLPPPRRPRHRRDGGLHPQPARSRRSPPPRWPRCARTSEREVGGRLRRHLGGPPRPGPGRDARIRRRPGRPPQPARPPAARTSTSTPPTCSAWTAPAAVVTEDGRPHAT